MNKDGALFFLIGAIVLLGSFMLQTAFYAIVIGTLGVVLIGLSILMMWPIDPIVPMVISGILCVFAMQKHSILGAILAVLFAGITLGMFLQRGMSKL